MDLLLVVLRLAHVAFGAIWVGMFVFTVIFLTPAIQEVGPDGAKVMGALQRRGLMTVLPILALGTLISGFWLYWRLSGGLQPGYLTSPGGLAFGLGGVASLAAYVIGITVMRPAMLRAVALGQTAAGAAPEERERRVAELQRLRTRGAVAGRWVAALLLAALAAMAVARYL